MSKALVPRESKSLSVSEEGLERYLSEIHRIPLLAPEEEYILARQWIERADVKAAHRLVLSHLRLVAKIASGYRGYGLPYAEMVSEGNIGLLQAVKRFDPEKGFRLATYAIWWIRAAIQDYILRSWSLVKIGTTAAQKRLFFNLRRLKNKMRSYDEGHLKHEEIQQIAQELEVGARDVEMMGARMSTRDLSLQSPLGEDGAEWQDWLPDESADQETEVIDKAEKTYRYQLLRTALAKLKPRDREIFQARRLADPAETLDALSRRYHVSRERIRQIENATFLKIQRAIESDERYYLPDPDRLAPQTPQP